MLNAGGLTPKKYDMKAKLKKVFKNSDFETAVIMNTNSKDSNFLYLTGFNGGVFEQSILVADTNSSTLITSELEYETALEQAPNGMEVIKASSSSDIKKSLLDSIKGTTVGIDYGFLPYSYFLYIKKVLQNRKITDSTQQFAMARETKDAYEISAMRKAVSITKKSLSEIGEYFKTGMSENELRSRFEFIMGNNGSEGIAFDSIVSFGKNAALPHHMPDSSRLKENEFVLIDVGARFNNYCADMTRTFIFKPDVRSQKYKKMEAMVTTVKEAQEIGLSHIKSGADGSEAHRAVSDFIDSTKGGIYKGCFIHSLGHQIGIDVHDGIGLSPRAKILKPNMVVSDEPGIYIPGFGGVRFEDDVLVADSSSSFL